MKIHTPLAVALQIIWFNFQTNIRFFSDFITVYDVGLSKHSRIATLSRSCAANPKSEFPNDFGNTILQMCEWMSQDLGHSRFISLGKQFWITIWVWNAESPFAIHEFIYLVILLNAGTFGSEEAEKGLTFSLPGSQGKSGLTSLTWLS